MKLTLLKSWPVFLGRGFERHPWLGLIVVALLVAGVLVVMITPPSATDNILINSKVAQPARPVINQELRTRLMERFSQTTGHFDFGDGAADPF